MHSEDTSCKFLAGNDNSFLPSMPYRAELPFSFLFPNSLRNVCWRLMYPFAVKDENSFHSLQDLRWFGSCLPFLSHLLKLIVLLSVLQPHFVLTFPRICKHFSASGESPVPCAWMLFPHSRVFMVQV